MILLSNIRPKTRGEELAPEDKTFAELSTMHGGPLQRKQKEGESIAEYVVCMQGTGTTWVAHWLIHSPVWPPYPQGNDKKLGCGILLHVQLHLDRFHSSHPEIYHSYLLRRWIHWSHGLPIQADASQPSTAKKCWTWPSCMRCKATTSCAGLTRLYSQHRNWLRCGGPQWFSSPAPIYLLEFLLWNEGPWLLLCRLACSF